MSEQITLTRKQMEAQIIEVIKTIYDPEIPVDIYELGLIYEVKIGEKEVVDITMTLTSPSCPVAESLPKEVEDKVKGIWFVKDAHINLVWEPSWEKDMMSEEAKLELGFL